MDSTQPYRAATYRALVAAARQNLEEDGLQAVGLRATARRGGVSSTATYRHFTSKDDLLASVAAEGFHELAAAMGSATRVANPLTRAGLAYIDFACQNPGDLASCSAGPRPTGEMPGAPGRDPGIETLLLRVSDLDLCLHSLTAKQVNLAQSRSGA